MQVWLQAYIRNPAHGITRPEHRQHPDLDLLRPLVSVAAFVASAGLMLLGFVVLSRLALIAIFPLMVLYGRRHRRLLAVHVARHAAGAPAH